MNKKVPKFKNLQKKKKLYQKLIKNPQVWNLSVMKCKEKKIIKNA